MLFIAIEKYVIHFLTFHQVTFLKNIGDSKTPKVLLFTEDPKELVDGDHVSTRSFGSSVESNTSGALLQSARSRDELVFSMSGFSSPVSCGSGPNPLCVFSSRESLSV